MAGLKTGLWHYSERVCIRGIWSSSEKNNESMLERSVTRGGGTMVNTIVWGSKQGRGPWSESSP